MPIHHNFKRTVLVTGAAGHFGSSFAQRAAEKYRLRLFVREGQSGIENIREFGEIHAGVLGDGHDLTAACQGIDTVVHLAASPDPSAVWEGTSCAITLSGRITCFLSLRPPCGKWLSAPD